MPDNLVSYEVFTKRYYPLSQIPDDLATLFKANLPEECSDFIRCFWDAFLVESYKRFQLAPLTLLAIASKHRELLRGTSELLAENPQLAIITLADERYLRIPHQEAGWIDVSSKELINFNALPSFTVVHSINLYNIVMHFSCTDHEANKADKSSC